MEWRSFPRCGGECPKSICPCFTSQPLRMKSQTAEINGSFAIDFNGPKMSSSVFYYTQKPDVRISTALCSTVQHNSIHHSKADHIITQALFTLTSMVRFILVFFSLYHHIGVGAGKNLSHVCQQYSFIHCPYYVVMVKVQI